MNYLSIDNALAVSGWAVWEDKKLVKYGTFKTKSTDNIEKRLYDIKYEIIDLIDDNRIDQVFFEDCQSQNNRNMQTYHKLSMVKATILLTCFEKEKPTICLSPSSWRSILNTKFKFKFGRARAEQKKRAKEFVKEHFNVDATEDECDAICLGYAGILNLNNQKGAW